jgi:PTH1 family peptidyl-tRNA hydrolase
MGLFARQPLELKQNLPYTLSFATATKLIVGLGNPGQEYNLTRHNLGFMVIDFFAKNNQFSPWQENKKFKGWVSEKTMGSYRVILFKPSTFMNLSGEAVQAIASFYHIELADIAVVHDELSISFGQIRSRIGGQAAGHNGIKSIIQHMGTDFGRFRIGIKNDLANKTDQSDFVLKKLSKDEQAVLPTLLNEVGGMLTEYIYSNELPHDTRKIITE